MPSLEQAISTEAAALERGRKPAIPLQREEEREEEEDLVTEQRMRMQWEGDVAAECVGR